MSSVELQHRSTLIGDATNYAGPIHSISQRAGDSEEVVDEVLGQHPIHYCDWFEDFLGDVLPDQINLYDQSPSGSPTLALIADEPNGVLEMTLSSTNEHQIIGMDWGNQRLIRATKAPYWVARLNVKVLPSTNERMVFGLADDLPTGNHPTLDNFTSNIWFRLEASGLLLVESDDGTTDTDDQSTGVTLTADTWYIFCIDMRKKGAIVFSLANGDGTKWRKVGQTAASALAATPTLQPVMYVQKESGTGVPSLYCDLARCRWER